MSVHTGKENKLQGQYAVVETRAYLGAKLEDSKIDGLFSLEDLDCVFWPAFSLQSACWEGKTTSSVSYSMFIVYASVYTIQEMTKSSNGKRDGRFVFSRDGLHHRVCSEKPKALDIIIGCHLLYLQMKPLSKKV